MVVLRRWGGVGGVLFQACATALEGSLFLGLVVMGAEAQGGNGNQNRTSRQREAVGCVPEFYINLREMVGEYLQLNGQEFPENSRKDREA